MQNVTIGEAEPLAWQAAVPSPVIIKQGPEMHSERGRDTIASLNAQRLVL